MCTVNTGIEKYFGAKFIYSKSSGAEKIVKQCFFIWSRYVSQVFSTFYESHPMYEILWRPIFALVRIYAIPTGFNVDI